MSHRPRPAQINTSGSSAGDVLTSPGAGSGPAAWDAPSGGAPSGAAGGDLAGTYPNPTIGSAGMEAIRDMLASVIAAGTGITVTVSDAGDTITIEATGGAGYTDEQVRDVMGVALVAGGGVSITVNDAGDTITVASSGIANIPIAYAVLAGDTTITSSTWGAVASATDLVLAAVAGDVIEVDLATRVDNANSQIFQDAYSMVSGSPVNSIGLNTAAPTGTSGVGVLPWVADASQFYHPGGSIFYVVQAGDLSGGNITIRWYARRTSINKTIAGGSRFSAKNWG